MASSSVPPPNTAAIFSPSVARQAASTAKDWNYIDSWLSGKLHGRMAPPFERGPDTLRALLALAALNEAADEERDLVARAEAEALREVKTFTAATAAAATVDGDDREEGAKNPAGDDISLLKTREDVLTALEATLTKEGKTALNAMAQSAVGLGLAQAGPERIGRGMLDLQVLLCDVEQAAARVDTLRRHVDAEAARAQADVLLLRRGDDGGSGAGGGDDSNVYDRSGGDAAHPHAHPPAADLARQNLDLQRRVKAATAKLPELRDKVAGLSAAAAAAPSYPTIEQVRRQEDEFLALAARRRELDAEVASFQGLPADVRLARRELERRRAELRALSQQRDAVFEGLVERETPRRPRR